MALGTIARAKTEKADATAAQPIELAPPRMGVVTFTNPVEPSSGLAFLEGKGPIYFDNPLSLAADVLWLSNSTAKIDLGPNFRSGAFFRTGLDQISRDLGYTQEIAPQLMDEEQRRTALECIKDLSKVIARARDIAVKVYPWRDFYEDWAQPSSNPSLDRCIGRILPATGSKFDTIAKALDNAYQQFSVPLAVGNESSFAGEGMVPMALINNRLRYAQYLCSQPVPVDAWFSIPDLAAHGIGLDELLNPERPSLTQVSVECSTDFSSAVTPQLVAFGSDNYGRGRTKVRQWVSQPELAWLVEHAKVTPISAHISTGYRSLSASHQLPPALLADESFALSISAGLVAECHWVGISARRWMRIDDKLVEAVTPTAVWMRAMDRAYCFQMARIVAERGFRVTGYGYGGVRFYAQRGNLGPVLELAELLQTSHPNLDAEAKRLAMIAGGDLS